VLRRWPEPTEESNARSFTRSGVGGIVGHRPSLYQAVATLAFLVLVPVDVVQPQLLTDCNVILRGEPA
jgi:hypothetical protein